MATEVIEIEVEPKVAEQYRRATPEDRQRFGRLLSSIVRHPVSRQEAGAELIETMRKMSQKAQARGLTPEILESILRDE